MHVTSDSPTIYGTLLWRCSNPNMILWGQIWMLGITRLTRHLPTKEEVVQQSHWSFKTSAYTFTAHISKLSLNLWNCQTCTVYIQHLFSLQIVLFVAVDSCLPRLWWPWAAWSQGLVTWPWHPVDRQWEKHPNNGHVHKHIYTPEV